jgi:F-type H+-transporting ATPase subunit b
MNSLLLTSVVGTSFGIAPAFAQEPMAPEGVETVAHEGAEGHAEHHESAVPWDKLAIGAVNLAIFLVILFFLARKPFIAALTGRAASIRSGLDDAARMQAEAKARFDSVEARLAALDNEIEEMRVDAREDAEREAVTLRQRGEVEAVRIKETVERAIREEAGRARSEIRKEAVQLAVALARETISRSMTQEDQERLAREFLAAVDADRTGLKGQGA